MKMNIKKDSIKSILITCFIIILVFYGPMFIDYYKVKILNDKRTENLKITAIERKTKGLINVFDSNLTIIRSAIFSDSRNYTLSDNKDTCICYFLSLKYEENKEEFIFDNNNYHNKCSKVSLYFNSYKYKEPIYEASYGDSTIKNTIITKDSFLMMKQKYFSYFQI